MKGQTLRAQIYEDDSAARFTASSVLEMVLWQGLMSAGYVDPEPIYNHTIGQNVTELYGAYETSQWDGNSTHASIPMTATT